MTTSFPRSCFTVSPSGTVSVLGAEGLCIVCVHACVYCGFLVMLPGMSCVLPASLLHSYEEALTALADSEAKQETGARELKMAYSQIASLWAELQQMRKQIDGSATTNGSERLVGVPLWVHVVRACAYICMYTYILYIHQYYCTVCCVTYSQYLFHCVCTCACAMCVWKYVLAGRSIN